MSEITITIDGKECKTQEGEFVLNIARENDIFIPAICYITRCSPTLACRICLVEADGKQAYACNAKAKDGMTISTSTENIEEERRAIMEVYDVNHPLECGVCDQSGECELQNYTLELGVDKQNYSIADSHKTVEHWGLINYDPALCIVCERCVTTCKDMIGDGALKTVARGTEALSKELKDEMPKDAYAMWNKLNKSLIGPSSGDTLDCTDCGECIAVCPVGALVSSDFQYTTNAWELNQVPAACAHCSAGCQIEYDVKHTSTQNAEDKIYRVKNEWNYTSLCGAGRFGYDYENSNVTKDETAFNSAIEAFKKADTINFDSFITNEEALILQRIKEKLGVKLYNKEASAYSNFMSNYSKTSGKTLDSSTLKTVHNSNFVVSVGSALKTDNPRARYAMNNSLAMNKGAGLYFHPLGDPVIAGMSKNVMQIEHAPLNEEAVMYLLLDLFAKKDELSSELQSYLASFHSTKTITVEETIKEKVVEIVKDEESGEEKEVSKMVPKKVSKEVEVDENALLALIGAPTSFSASMEKFLKKKDTFSLIVGEDFFNHPQSANLATLVALFEKHSEFDVLIVPPSTNTLGVSLICDLDDSNDGYTVGLNVSGDFTLGSNGRSNLDLPALNQQEGTFTNVDKRVIPTNAALAYSGYTLNDIANALGVGDKKYTIDYTSNLPQNSGFESTTFDNLKNEFTNSGEELRGYALNVQDVTIDSSIAPKEILSDIWSDEDITIYRANPVIQFNDATKRSHQLNENGALYVSQAFMDKYELKENQSVRVKTKNTMLDIEVKLDNKISGHIACVPTFDDKIDAESLFDSYRFNKATLTKV